MEDRIGVLRSEYHVYPFLLILINSFISYSSSLTNFVLKKCHSAPVIHTEEYAPHTIPTISGSANSLIELTPSANKTATIINVVRDV